MNKVILTGRLTRDPVVRYLTGENPTAIASFSLAVNRPYSKDREQEADFFECTAFGKTAEVMEKYWKKGMKADLSGRLENNNWTDREGRRHFDVRVHVENLEFGEAKKSREDAEALPGGGFIDLPEDDDKIPFVF